MTHRLYRLLTEIEKLKLFYRIDRHRPDTILITITAVGERLEIDVFDDGHVEFSRFRGDESVDSDEGALMPLLTALASD